MASSPTRRSSDHPGPHYPRPDRPRPDRPDPHRAALLAAAVVLLATVGQLAVATFVPGIDRFDGKAFGARLLAYPVMMLLAPALWWFHQRRTGRRDTAPWGAFALVMVPFLVDVTGNTLDLYDRVAWWDDLNHFVNWIPLCAGLGLLLLADVAQRWQVVLLVAGLGALLAIGWELGEWWTFIRHGTELDTAYTDTLGDEALGTTGGIVAGILLAASRRPATL
ncbi:hypothetical protein [Nocardioides jiangxiensis]|uniref:VanZ like family protein n=1 Tax=Nocardioides jiangxiensis TaxID=3064524 RepID=A0ABT9B4G3_9ACTN|nr:hypothetical protein [Nocardioides sp. WY-20]MDO7869618.1 hypothetical protein [Nocardioides sp. WY-20]